jgi:myo-inositol catabolism protein IolC
MDWRKRTPAEKAKWLKQQMEDIQRTRALLDRFERVTQKWLKRLEPRKKSR